MAAPLLEEDKRLSRFFATDKTPRKRLRTALDFVRNCTEEQEHEFFTKFYMTVYLVIASTLKQYEKLKQNDWRVEESTGFMSKLRKKHIGIEDWQDVFELFRRLLRHCMELMNKGWQRNGITETLMKFTHPGNDHKIRIGAYQLLIQYCDILQHLDGQHMQLLASCIDYPIIQSFDPILSTRNSLSWSLPPVWMEEPIDVLKSDSLCDGPEAVEILDLLLRHTVAGQGSRPQATSSTTASNPVVSNQRIEHFSYWLEVLFRYFFPVFFPRAFSPTIADEPSQADMVEGNILNATRDTSVGEGSISAMSFWSPSQGFEVCPLLIQLSLERWFDVVLSDSAFGNELWKSPPRAKLIEEMLRQRFVYRDNEGQKLMMRCMVFYHQIVSGEQLSHPSYVSTNFEYYMELFVTHSMTIFTLEPGSIPPQMQADLILSALSLFTQMMRQNLSVASCQRLREQMLLIVDESYGKFTSEALTRTCLDYLKCLFQCLLSAPDRLEKDVLSALISRITPWIVPQDYQKNLIGRHFITTWELHLINLLKGVLRFMDEAEPSHDQTFADDATAQYDPASRWEVNYRDWLKMTTLSDCLLLWDRVMHLLPPSILDQLDLSLHGLAVKAITQMLRVLIHEAAVPATHYIRLEPYAADYEQRANMKKDVKRRWKEEEKERMSPLSSLSPGCIFSLISAWILPVCVQPKIGYEESRALAFEALCTIVCTRTQAHLPEHLEVQALGAIAAGLSNGGSQTIASIVRHSKKLFALDIPGTTLLIKLYLKACRLVLLDNIAGEILRRTFSGGVRPTSTAMDGLVSAISPPTVRANALDILGCITCYANRYPQANVLPVDFSSSHDEVSMLHVKQEAGKILQEFISLPNTELALRKTAINNLFLMILDELYASPREKASRALIAEWFHKLTEYCNDVSIEISAVSMDCLKELSAFHKPLLEHFTEELYHAMLALCAVAWQQLVILVQHSMDYPSSPQSLPPTSPSKNVPPPAPRPDYQSAMAEIDQAGQRVVNTLDCMWRWMMCCPSLLEQRAVSQHFFEVLEASLIGKIPSLQAEGVANSAATPRMFRDLVGLRQKNNRGFHFNVFEKPGEKAEDVLFHLLNHLRHYPLIEGCAVMDSISATEFFGLGKSGETYGEVQYDEIDPGSAIHLVYHDSVLISLVGRSDGTAVFVVRDYVGTHAYKALPLSPAQQSMDANFLLYLLHRRVDNKSFRVSMIDLDTTDATNTDDFDLQFNPIYSSGRPNSSSPAVMNTLGDVSQIPRQEPEVDIELLDEAVVEGYYASVSGPGSSTQLFSESQYDVTTTTNLHAKTLAASSTELVSSLRRDDSVLVLKSNDYEERLQAMQDETPGYQTVSARAKLIMPESAENMTYRKVLYAAGIRSVDLKLDPLRDLLNRLPIDGYADPTLMGNIWTLARYEEHASASNSDLDYREAIQSEPDRLHCFLEDVEVSQELREFLKSEFAMESIDFCERVDHFKKINWTSVEDSQGRMYEYALDLFERYVKAGAPEEINVAATASAEIRLAIERRQITIDMFDEAYLEVCRMLARDKLGRFIANTRTRRIEVFMQCEEISRIVHLLCALEAKHCAKLSKDAAPYDPGPPATSISVLDPIRNFATQLCMIPADDVKNYKLLVSSDDAKWKAILRNLKHLDGMPVRELIKCGVLYVGEGQVGQIEILSNSSGSADYEDFVRGLGWEVDVHKHRGFTGKVDTNRCTNGKFFPYYANDEVEVFFHVATMMPNEEGDHQQVSKKRHVGNDIVHIVWSDHDREYPPLTITSDFGDVIIVIYPLKRAHQGLYRIQVISKIGLSMFGPLKDEVVVSRALLAQLVRATAINGNRTVREHQAAMSGIYEKPYPTRRRVISEIVQSFATPLTHLNLISLIFRTPTRSAASKTTFDSGTLDAASSAMEAKQELA